MKKVTIQDVAREMNLSRNTVARALHSGETVSATTRKAVLKKAAEMGYSKFFLEERQTGREEKKDRKKSGTIAVLARRETSVFWNSIIMGISDEINQTGGRLRLYFISDLEEKSRRLPSDFASDIGAVLLLSVFSPGFQDRILELKLPTVCLDMPEQPSLADSYGDIIYCEGRASIRTLTAHLLGKGLKSIGFIGDVTYCKTVKERYLGYLEAMQEAGVCVDENIIEISHVPGRYYLPGEVEAAISAMTYLPQAIVCVNDDIAFEVIRSLNKRKKRVPEDILVTGYDDVEETLQREPFLTTVHISNQQLGRRLVQQLFWRISHPEFPREILCIEGTLIYRTSTGD